MKLTRRQEQFVENLIDLSQELNGPIHYSMLAERLGVSPFTAYDMLRLLEEKGLVASEYQIAAGKSGPGRAERLFYPLQRNRGVAKKLGKAALNDADWKQFILKKIKQGKIPNKAFAVEMLSRIPPDGPEEFRFCLEMMLVVGLRLRERAGQQKFKNHLAEILPLEGEISRASLNLLGGFAFGILAQEEDVDREWSQMLFKQMLLYQDIVHKLSPQECRLLADELLTIFPPPPTNSKKTS